MNNTEIEVIANNMIDPIKKVQENFEKNFRLAPYRDAYGKEIYWHSLLYYHVPVFKSLSKDKGLGRFLFYIKNNPNLTKKEILYNLHCDSLQNETFQYLTKGELVNYSRKTGYVITPLGIAILQKFNIV